MDKERNIFFYVQQRKERHTRLKWAFIIFIHDCIVFAAFGYFQVENHWFKRQMFHKRWWFMHDFMLKWLYLKGEFTKKVELSSTEHKRSNLEERWVLKQHRIPFNFIMDTKTKAFFKRSFLFHRRKKVLQVWKQMMVSKWWPNFHCGVNYTFKFLSANISVQKNEFSPVF